MFYTNAFHAGNFIYFRGYDKGKRVQRKIKYKPSLFTRTDEESRYKTINGDNLQRLRFDDMKSAKDFMDNRRFMDDPGCFGFENFTAQFLKDCYGDKEASFDKNKVRVAKLDIEVDSSEGFPEPEYASAEIHLITIFVGSNKITFGLFDVDPDLIEGSVYMRCKDEETLLRSFLRFWTYMDPDVVTGWNVDKFDITYLYNRMVHILGESEANRISPWGKVWKNLKTGTYNIRGIEILDYMALYKKWKLNDKPENFKLDTVAAHELDEKKLDYSEYTSINEFCKNDPLRYTQYNVHDVRLIEKLENKLSLIQLAMIVAYKAKCNYSDFLTQIKLWDSFIFHHLAKKDIQIHTRFFGVNTAEDDDKYKGAFVKSPTSARYNWVVFFDASSLYPSIIMSCNIGADTIMNKRKSISVEDLLNGVTHVSDESETFAANGQFYRNDKQSFISEIVEGILIERKKYKKLMQEFEKAYINSKNIEDKYKQELYDMYQQALKVVANSCYGTVGSKYFRYYDVRNAEAITLTGQFIFKYSSKYLNKFFNERLETNDVDYVIAGDTDSVVINFEPLVEKECIGMSRTEIIDYIDMINKSIIEPYLTECMQTLGKQLNFKKNTISFKRESLCESAIWTAKKRYIASVWDEEGNRYNYPKIKVKGFEAIRSDTPNLCRAKIKNLCRIILTKDELATRRYARLFKQRFKSYSIDQIAKPTSVNDIEKYIVGEDGFGKSCPMGVRAAIMFNKWVKEKGLDRSYDKIRSGDKIKICPLIMPNPTGQNVIAITSSLPAEFELDKYVDYDLQFYKTFIRPTSSMLAATGWDIEEESSLLDLLD